MTKGLDHIWLLIQTGNKKNVYVTIGNILTLIDHLNKSLSIIFV